MQVRFRLKANSTNPSSGWVLDDVMMMDMENYNSTARLTSTQGDDLSSIADARGTIVEPLIMTPTKELADFDVRIFPNPTDNLLTVNTLPDFKKRFAPSEKSPVVSGIMPT